MRKIFLIIVGIGMLCSNVTAQTSESLWDLANENKDLLRVSTIFTAQGVRRQLSTEEGLQNAIDWCKNTGVTRVFIESYRGLYYAERDVLENARDRFNAAGIEASGCVTTTQISKISTGWEVAACYTSLDTQEELQKIFEYTASMFDVIMIDDFLFTDCDCDECIEARGEQSWAKYRSDLMVKMSRERILKPAKAVNPNVKIINKYPKWYDVFHERGYEVVRETEDYDLIWVGTETRDYDFSTSNSGTVQYEAYYIMRWLGGIGGEKTGGGWFDALGTTPKVYLEQARQTVLADAKEMMLFSYGGLIRETNNYNNRQGTGVANVEALRIELPGLFKLAEIVRGKPIKGIHAPKPPNSDAFEESWVYDFFGMIGLPLVPAHEIDVQAESAVFAVQVLKEPNVSGKLERMLTAGKPVIVTDGLARRLTDQALLDNENLTVLTIDGDPKSLLNLSQDELKPIRDKALAPFGLQFDAPNKVALYLIGDNHFIVENFNDEPVDATLDFNQVSGVRTVLTLPEDGSARLSRNRNSVSIRNLSPRTLLVVEYR